MLLVSHALTSSLITAPAEAPNNVGLIAKSFRVAGLKDLRCKESKRRRTPAGVSSESLQKVPEY